MGGLRVTGGSLKGRSFAPSPDARTRYTSSKVRAAVFDLVGDVSGCLVLDLFAGSGSFTIEALSRGASRAVCVEKDARTAAVLRANLGRLGLDKHCLVYNSDVRYALRMLAKRERPFGLVFMDPPYEMGYLTATLPWLMKGSLCDADTLVIVEHSKREAIPDSVEREYEVRQRRYGDTLVSLVTRGATPKGVNP